MIILIVAALARYWGIGFGLPHAQTRPDEQGVVIFTINFFSGDFNPHNFHYPSFYYYLLFVLFGGYYFLGRIGGDYASVSDLFWEFKLDRTNFHLIDRFFSAFLGVATVFVVYKIARRFFDRQTALISSLFLSLTALHVRDSHFGTTDVANVFWITLSILFIVKSYHDRNLKNYLLAGIAAGFSASTKYIGAMLLLPMAIVHFYNLFDEKKQEEAELHSMSKKERKAKRHLKQEIRSNFSIEKLFSDKRILSFVLALFLTFLVTTPYAILDFPTFSHDFLYVFGTIDKSWKGHMVTIDGVDHYINLGTGWWYHIRYSLFLGLGWSLFFASFAGLFLLIKKNLKKALILFSFPAAFYVLIGIGYSVFLRYTLPLLPFLCITGALFTVFVADKLANYLKFLQQRTVVSLVAVLIILPSTYNVIRSDMLLTKKDSRLLAADWVNDNIPVGSSLYQPGIFWGNVWLHPTSILTIKRAYYSGTEEQKKALKVPMKYLVTNNIKGYNHWGYDNNRGKFFFNNQHQNTLPQYIIARDSPIKEYDMFNDNIAKLLKTSYHLKKSFEVINVNNKENWFDRQDAFYLPFAGFKEVERPGPNIYIYEKNS